MLKSIRQKIIQNLWETYSDNSWQIKHIVQKLKSRGIEKIALDHFAVIDLPGPHTGISQLKQIFTALGFVTRGSDYLAEKQNDFLWLAEEDCNTQVAYDVLPQVVVADFRLEEMPANVKQIVEKYSHQSSPLAVKRIEQLIEQLLNGNNLAETQLIKQVCEYFSGRDWPLPTVHEFHQVQEFNELIAWVLVYGRRPNHFTLSVHLLDAFATLTDFHHFIEEEADLTLNKEGGAIKGGEQAGIAQGSTVGDLTAITLADGKISIPDNFVEFVWRFPAHEAITKPILWKDYFTGFIAQHADRVIESLYTTELNTEKLQSA